MEYLPYIHIGGDGDVEYLSYIHSFIEKFPQIWSLVHDRPQSIVNYPYFIKTLILDGIYYRTVQPN